MIGVLALQGDYGAHEAVLHELGHETLLVRSEADFAKIDALVIPGGESTVMSRMFDRYSLWEPLRARCAAGLPVLGTCAGMIFLAREIRGGASTFPQKTLGLLDIQVERNAYGAQLDSFETDVEVKGLEQPVRAVFIRAPRVLQCGAAVEVLATHNDSPVIVRQDNVWAVAFHPEIVNESNVHRLWLRDGFQGDPAEVTAGAKPSQGAPASHKEVHG